MENVLGTILQRQENEGLRFGSDVTPLIGECATADVLVGGYTNVFSAMNLLL